MLLYTFVISNQCFFIVYKYIFIISAEWIVSMLGNHALFIFLLWFQKDNLFSLIADFICKHIFLPKINGVILDSKNFAGETLLSPLVMCGPHGLQFKRPVELRLPHAASVSPNTWSFALKSSDTPTGQPTQWTNMSLADAPHSSHVGANCVSVLVDHFWRPMCIERDWMLVFCEILKDLMHC